MPQVLTHGLVASGGIFLRIERCQILRYFRQILATLVDSLADRGETGTLIDRCADRLYARDPTP